MWLRYLLFVVLAIFDTAWSELLSATNRIDAPALRPFASLLLALDPAAARFSRQRPRSRSRLHSAAPSMSDVAIAEKVEETTAADEETKASSIVEQSVSGIIKSHPASAPFAIVWSPGLKAKYGSDAILWDQQMGSLEVGDAITFDVKLSQNGKPSVFAPRFAESISGYEVDEFAKAARMDTLDSATALADIVKITDSFTKNKTSVFEGLEAKWNSGSQVFRACGDASDLDGAQRSMLIGSKGYHLNQVTESTGVDFIWLDAAGDICIYGVNESQVREATSIVSQKVAFQRFAEKHWRNANKRRPTKDGDERGIATEVAAADDQSLKEE